MNSRRRDDRSASATDHYKQWAQYHDKYDYDSDRRRNRSSTLPSNSYDQRSYPSHDTRYHDARQPTRSHRQDPHHNSAPPSSSYQQSSAPAPSTSRTYQHATRPSAQYAPSGYHYPQPNQQPTHPMSAHPASTHPVASSSRRPYPEMPDPRTSRRAVPAPVPQSSYEQMSSGEDLPRASKYPSRTAQSSSQPPHSAPAYQQYWTPAPEMSSRRLKDPLRDRERTREREMERERASTDVERDGYREKARADRYRERERERERVSEVKYQEPSRSKPPDRRKDSDTEGAVHSEQRNASKASLSGREGYAASIRESSGGHRRHRTEDGTATTSSRRNHPESVQNPITTMPTGGPLLDGQQTAKSHRSYREGRPSTAQGAQSGSDTERSTGKHRTERTPSGPAVQRADGYISSSMRDRSINEVSSGPRDDLKREAKYGVPQDTRQPPSQVNVDIPLITPGFHPSSLPTEKSLGSAVPQFVSIRAGQGPSDPQAYDAHFKSSAISHSDAPQGAFVQPSHSTSASIVKSSAHTHTRSQAAEIQSKPERSAVEYSRTEPHGVDQPPVYRMSIHESSRTLPTPISRSQSYARGNPETVDNLSSSRPSSRPPSRSGHRASASVPPTVAGPRTPRSISQGPQTNELPTRPPSVTQYTPIASSVPNQQSVHTVPPPTPHPDNASPAKVEHFHGSFTSTQANPESAQVYGVSNSNPPSVRRAASSGVPPMPVNVPETPTASSRPSTRQDIYPDAPNAIQHTLDRPSTAEGRSRQRKTSGSSTMKAAWIVQTAPAAAKGTPMSREEKYLRGPPQNVETPHPELRQVLSQDSSPFPRASSTMMRSNQAMTPPTSSQRSSPGAKAKDVIFGTPKGTMASSSPKSGHSKEVPTPEHKTRQNLPPHLAGPPQIAIVGATPITQPSDLPHQLHVNHSFLVPALPAPTRASRTTSTSREQQPQPTPRNVLPTSYQSLPAPPPAVQAHSLFQPYRPPTPPSPEESAQSSPPPLPVPPPRVFEDLDSPISSPFVEAKRSEIVPAHLQNNEDQREATDDFPHASSEILHKPSQQAAPWQTPPTFPIRSHEMLPSGKLERDLVSETPNGASIDPRGGVVKSTADAPRGVHPGSVKTMHASPVQTSEVTRSRPKVTIEDVPEDSPVAVNAMQGSTPPVMSVANGVSRSTLADQSVSRSSPQSKSKESPLHRTTEPSSIPPVAAPTIPATHAAITTRMPTSAPPNQPSFFPPPLAPPPQRSASYTVSSRTLQRATEMMQASKSSTTPGGTVPYATAGISKSTSAPGSTNVNAASTATGSQHLTNGATLYTSSTAKLTGVAAMTAPQSGTTSTYAAKAAIALPTTTSISPVGTTEQVRDMPVPASTSTAAGTITTGQQVVSSAGVQSSSNARHASASASVTPYTGAATTSYATKVASAYPTPSSSIPPVNSTDLGRDAPAPSTSANTQPLTPAELYKQQITRAAASQMPLSLNAPSTTLMSSGTVKNPHDQTIIDSTRLRDATPTPRNLPSSSHVYPTSARPGTSSALTPQLHHPPAAQPSIQHRTVSLPTAQTSSTPQKPPSPRKTSQPIPTATVSTQPFPSRPPPPDPQPTRASGPGHLSTPVPPRVTRIPSSDRAKDADILKTPSSIAPSPMLNADSAGHMSQLTAPPIRARQSSTDSRDSKKKRLFGLFRPRTLSSKQADPPVTSTTAKTSLDNSRDPTEVPVVSTITPAAHRVTSTSVPRESRERDAVPQAAAPVISQPRIKVSKAPDSIAMLPPATTHKDSTPHIFTPLKFLTMNSKRNRTVSAASLDVCDGNTATNTVVGSPDHSTVSQAPPLPPIITPDVRDPLLATTEWRDREEAERRERKKNRIRRPGVTFDLDEEPPSPPTGTGMTKRNRLVRRPTGRAPTRISTPRPARS